MREVVEQIKNAAALAGGVYNFGSETTKSMYEITRDFLGAIGKEIELQDAPAPHNLWLDCEKARRGGVTFRSVEKALLLCASDYGLLNL